MIGSFWNLCRACPSMPVDKLHSEYRSTYRWHEYTGPRQEIVRRPPQPNVAAGAGENSNEVVQNAVRVQDEDAHNQMPKLEPAMPRRKKHPDLAYRHHEFIVADGNLDGDKTDSSVERARSEERGTSHWRPSRRSKSEGPARGSALVNDEMEMERRRDSDPDLDNTDRDPGLLRKAISKISTEYRLQFAWPPGHASRRDLADSSAPRKSQSMGALKQPPNAIIHKKRIDLENKDASELEPLVNDKIIKEEEKWQKDAGTEYKKNFRPFSQYDYTDGRFTKREIPNNVYNETNSNILNGTSESWYREVVELRKKAGEYKHRGWGSELAPERLTDIYNKQVELWDQVSRRSSLSALSLASTAHRSYTKEEKEEENNKKSSPTKPFKNGENSARMMREMIRHHLERTTGGSEMDGLILSPTREKLEPTIPRKDDDSRGSQKNSPKKSSPMKSSVLKKTSQKSKSALRTVRSHSVGPPSDVNAEKRSPKRQLRSATVREKKISSSTAKRPRPSSLNTSTASSRSKSSSVPLKKEDERLANAKNKNAIDSTGQKTITNDAEVRKAGVLAEPTDVKTEKAEQEPVPQAERIDLEPVIKSPPEPTRVKSPEQILMRSPDPVNWTVPLDTGKTFTVTQNVREGDVSRPHSEIKAWTPPDVPPPELPQQAKEQAGQVLDAGDIRTTLLEGRHHKNSHKGSLEALAEEKETSDDDPTSLLKKPPTVIVQPSSESPCQVAPHHSLLPDVLQSARNRFDMFWSALGGDSSS